MRRLFVLVIIAALAGACGGSKKAASVKSPAPEDKTRQFKSTDDADSEKPGGGGEGAPAPTGSDPCEGGENKSDPCEGGEKP